jgi:hypothetical protein
MVDLSLAVVAVVVLLAAVVFLLREGPRLTRAKLGAGVAVIVLAAGTFAVTLYQSQTDRAPKKPARAAPAVTVSAAPTFADAVFPIDIPMTKKDNYPQGALYLNPPRPGTDPYTGDVSLGCYTPAKDEKDQNCTGSDERVWAVSPIKKGSAIAVASRDPFTDPAACDGAQYKADFVQLDLGKNYCLRTGTATDPVVGLRVVAFGAQQPLPTDIKIQAAVLSR